MPTGFAGRRSGERNWGWNEIRALGARASRRLHVEESCSV
jgi:hypothetical protein